MENNSKWRQAIIDMGFEGVTFLEPSYLDEAIIGMSHDDRVIYDYNKLVECFVVHNGMTMEEAMEWIDYNTIRSIPYIPNGPVILTYSLEEYFDEDENSKDK